MPDARFFSSHPSTASQLAILVGAELQGTDCAITHASPLQTAGEGAISFLDNKKYVSALAQSQASACIIHPKQAHKAPQGMALLLTEQPYAGYAQIAAHLHPQAPALAGIAPTASVDASAVIGENVYVGAHAVIEADVEIGANSVIHPHAVLRASVQVGQRCEVHPHVCISHTLMGDDVIIHRGTMIGQDGFGYAFAAGKHLPVPQLGRVIIEDDVHIGANCTIDRGAGPDTLIGTGSRLDNLVQIGHNVQIGTGCVIVSHVGISGSAQIGDYSVIGGQVGIGGHLQIGKHVQIAAQSGVMKDIADGEVYGGSPAVPIKQFHRQSVILAKLAKGKNKHKDSMHD